MTDFKNLEDTYGLSLFKKREIALVRGKNDKVWDENGKEYIDCTSGHGVASIGHANDKLIEALRQQAGKLITCTGSFYNETRAMLMDKLVKISPPGLVKTFLCNSGAESVEAAFKFVRLNHKKTEFISAMRGFHGRTFGALSATFNPNYRHPFEPLVPGFHFVPFNNIDKLAETINDNTAAVILEVVQGEGGIHIGDPDYFNQVQQICSEKKIFLIIDEVQTGFGRTGKFFACDHFKIKPDLLCISKAMAGGFPIGAVLCSSAIKVPYGKHGTTFGGNPLACAASLATIEFIIENDLPQQAEKKGAFFAKKFVGYNPEIVREVRQIGLMIGIELKEKSQPFINKLQEDGVLVLAAGTTVIRLLPPLTIGYKELEIVIEKILHVLSKS
jgi:acetylornithine/LysW-gamma-L-lysine aminotransferase